jgi:DNA-binding transcriptional regulator YdaS (Cro superfamily)
MAKRKREVTKLLKYFDEDGRIKPTAEAMGVSDSLVRAWHYGTAIPTTDHAIKAEVRTSGHVTANKLKPDLDHMMIRNWFRLRGWK